MCWAWHAQRAISQHCDPCLLWATKTTLALFVAIPTMEVGWGKGVVFQLTPNNISEAFLLLFQPAHTHSSAPSTGSALPSQVGGPHRGRKPTTPQCPQRSSLASAVSSSGPEGRQAHPTWEAGAGHHARTVFVTLSPTAEAAHTSVPCSGPTPTPQEHPASRAFLTHRMRHLTQPSQHHRKAGTRGLKLAQRDSPQVRTTPGTTWSSSRAKQSKEGAECQLASQLPPPQLFLHPASALSPGVQGG